MFGYFKRKLHHVNCPVCLREFTIKFNPEEVKKFNYKYKEGAGVVYTLECDFCSGEAKVVLYKTGEVDTLDHKWFQVEEKNNNEIESARSELYDVREKLDKEPGNKELRNERSIIEKKLRNLEKNFRADKKKYSDYVKESRESWAEELKHL